VATKPAERKAVAAEEVPFNLLSQAWRIVADIPRCLSLPVNQTSYKWNQLRLISLPSTCRIVGYYVSPRAISLVLSSLTADNMFQDKLGRRIIEAHTIPAQIHVLRASRRIPKNRIPEFDPESRTQSLKYDVINKCIHNLYAHRHTLASVSTSYMIPFPSPSEPPKFKFQITVLVP